MAAPFVRELLGRRSAPPHLPNNSDAGGATSRRIAENLLELLGATEIGAPERQTAGSRLEILVAKDLSLELPLNRPELTWTVSQVGTTLWNFAQYEHLQRLQSLIDADKTHTLRTAIGRDYEVAPDVTVGVSRAKDSAPMLHASVSCKFTLRSDRAQNVRQESATLTKQRKGRLPHIVVVTAEPLPTRIASIAQGTGDVDAVYHVALDELTRAVASSGSQQQAETLSHLIEGSRLFDYTALPVVLSF